MAERRVDAVVKVGGGMLEHGAAALDGVLGVLAAGGGGWRAVVVPGGGPFADAVREVDRRLGLGHDAAHWMAVLAMDQYAELLASRAQGATVAWDAHDVGAALAAGALPVLAPSRWLRARDPLPHAWEVTSDSIAAWFAGELGASSVVLVKPPGTPAGEGAVDGYFARALPAGVRRRVVAADRLEELRSALRESVGER